MPPLVVTTPYRNLFFCMGSQPVCPSDAKPRRVPLSLSENPASLSFVVFLLIGSEGVVLNAFNKPVSFMPRSTLRSGGDIS